jgi:hypothetical protein
VLQDRRCAEAALGVFFDQAIQEAAEIGGGSLVQVRAASA